jgi:hypothetical protein
MLEDYDVLRAAACIVDGKEADYAYQRTLGDTLRAFVAMHLGDDAWMDCNLLCNLLNGQEVYTAFRIEMHAPRGNIVTLDSRLEYPLQRLMRCVVILRDEFGQFEIAPWSPVD